MNFAAILYAFRHGKVSLTKLAFLQLCEKEPTHMADIIKAIGFTAAAASFMAETLVQQGYLTRETTPLNRRKVVCHTTENGRQFLRKAIKAAMPGLTPSPECNPDCS